MAEIGLLPKKKGLRYEKISHLQVPETFFVTLTVKLPAVSFLFKISFRQVELKITVRKE